MSAQDDARYMQLYREYAKAIQGYQNALEDRKRIRARLANKARVAKASTRRPVGSPPGFRGPDGGKMSATPLQGASVRKVYMGPLLGWAKLVGTSPGTQGEAEPGSTFDVETAYDAMSLKLYWNAKTHYEKCKRAFFDYVRLKNMEHHRQEARAALSHEANLQLLGVEDRDALADAQREIEASCRDAWGLYQSTPEPKPRSAVLLLLESLADAQFVGLESSVTRQMSREMDRLTHLGILAQER